ncbi:beta-N-acetylhexosaminidase [Parvibaculum sp.]|uniref:beta-N-acetylhexosaminidase n=1 Tax=Parvibaculum sp. TaxID=2024848 RepID=UPI0032109492
MSVSAAIYGCEGLSLTEAEKRFFAEVRPWGFIIFARNIETPEQVKRLIGELRAAAGHDAPVLIDQEGGRVARLRPPHWRAYPAGRRFGELYTRSKELGIEAARLGARLIAAELHALGINVDCLPVLDVPVPGAHDVIGDRAYGLTPEPVIALGRAAAEGLLAGGVLPVIKHIPGHGRAGVDSHLSLPVVDADRAALAATDFAPFKALADMPLAMTAHVVYTALDAGRPATTSAKVISEVIRRDIGFDGFLMSDDLSMQALAGTLAERARASLAAGCDIVLHCNGKMDEMLAIASEAPTLAGKALARSDAALARLAPPAPLDESAGVARLDELLSRLA